MSATTTKAAPPAEEKAYPSVPCANVFEAYEESHGAILTTRGTARIGVGISAIRTLTSVLFQRELDIDTGHENTNGALNFGSSVAMGLLHAIAVCAEYIEDAADGRTSGGATVGHDGPEYEALEAAIARHRELRRARGLS